jgi:hypothetical protein
MRASWQPRHPPPDIVTGNRPALEGRLWIIRPAGLFRDPTQVPPTLLDSLEARLHSDEHALGSAVIEALSWSPRPVGVPWRQLHPDQRELLTALLGVYQ